MLQRIPTELLPVLSILNGYLFLVPCSCVFRLSEAHPCCILPGCSCTVTELLIHPVPVRRWEACQAAIRSLGEGHLALQSLASGILPILGMVTLCCSYMGAFFISICPHISLLKAGGGELAFCVPSPLTKGWKAILLVTWSCYMDLKPTVHLLLGREGPDITRRALV